METNLSDLSLVSPSVAAAALRDQDGGSMLNGKWAPTPTGSIVDHIMNRIDEQFNIFSNNIALPGRRVGANANIPPSLSSVLDRNGLDAGSDCESNASTMQLLEGCKQNEMAGLDAEAPTGLPDDVANQVNAQYEEIMKNKGNRRNGMETESVRTEDFANKFNLIAVPSGSNRTPNTALSGKTPLRDASNRIYPSAVGLSNTLPRTGQQSAPFSPARLPSASGSNSNATRAGLLRAAPVSAKPLEQTFLKPIMFNAGSARSPGKYSNNPLVHELQPTGSGLTKPYPNGLSAYGTFPRSTPVNGQLGIDVPTFANGRSHKEASNGYSAYSAPLQDSTMERLQAKIGELEELNKQVRTLRHEKETIIDEVERMSNLLKQQQLEIRNFDSFRASTKSKTESIKNDLDSMQQKRDATVNELQQLNADLAQRKDKLSELEGSARRRMEEIRQFESLGFTKQEIDALVAQRNELFELVTRLEKDETQHYEVQKQLEQTNHDRFKDQRAFHEQFAQLSAQLQQVVQENATLKGEIDRLRDDATGVKRDRDSFLEQAVTQYKQRLHREVAEVQKKSENELAALRQELYNATEKIVQLQRDLERKNNALQTVNLEKQRLQEQVDRVKSNDTEELSRFYENFQRQNGDALRNLQHRLTEEREEALRNQDARFKSETEQYRLALLEKDKECMVMRDKLRYMESTCEQLSSRLSRDNMRAATAQTGTYEELVKDILEPEKRKWKDEHERVLGSVQNELLNARKERERTVRHLNEELHSISGKLGEMEAELISANAELDKERQQRLQQAAEKLREMAKVREECNQTLQSEQEQMQAQVQQAQHEIQKLKTQLSELQKKIEEDAAKESELVAMLPRFVKPVLNEIDGDFADICSLLAMEPAIISTPFARQANLESVGDALRNILTNVRDAFMNIRNAVEAFCRDVARMRQLLDSYDEQKMVEVDEIREQLAADSERKVEELRESMMRSYTEDIKRVSLNSSLKNGDAGDVMSREQQSKWKQETAEKIAAKLQSEFRSELDRRSNELQQTIRQREAQLLQLCDERAELEERLKAQKVVVDEAATKTVKQLHEQLKHLRDENLDLHKAVSTARKISASQQNLFEEPADGAVFARRPATPTRPGSSMRNTYDRRSLPIDFPQPAQVRFSPTAASNNNNASFEAPQNDLAFNHRSSSPFVLAQPFYPAAAPSARPGLNAPLTPGPESPFNDSPTNSGLSPSNRAAASPLGREFAQPYPPLFTAESDDQANEAAKNKSLRQLDKDYNNLQAKLQQRTPPTFRSLNAGLNSTSASLGPNFTNGNGNGMLSRTTPMVRPFSRMLPKSTDAFGKPAYYETSM